MKPTLNQLRALLSICSKPCGQAKVGTGCISRYSMTGRVKLFLISHSACSLVNFCPILYCSWPNKCLILRKNGQNRSSVHQGHRLIWTLHFFLHSDKGYCTSPLLDESYTHSCWYVKSIHISNFISQIQFRSLHRPQKFARGCRSYSYSKLGASYNVYFVLPMERSSFLHSTKE